MAITINGTTGIAGVDGSASTPAVQGGDTNTGVFFPAADTVAIATSGTEAMRADSAGNVGIGTSSPAYKLDVNGGINSQTGFVYLGNANVYANYRSGNNDVIYSGASGFFYYQNITSTYHAWYTGNSERARIDSSGNLLVGTASQARTEKLNVTQSANSVGLEVNCTNASYNQAGVFIDTTRAANSAFQFLYCSANTVAQLFIKGDGGISNYSANNTNLSDERVKTNISLADGYLAKICAIPVKTFNYKSEPEGEQKTLGVIAQDVEAVAPELVNNDGFGELPEDGVPLKTIYQTDLQYALMKCIQEQQALINDLTARIAALEAA